MTETGNRRTTREKKPPKQYWYDQADYSNLVSSKTHQPKEKNNQADTTQIAKLLMKFIQSSNSRLKEMPDGMILDQFTNLMEQSKEQDISQHIPKKGDTGRLPENNENKNNRHDEPNQPRTYNRNNKPRVNKTQQPSQNISKSLEEDRKIQNSITEHLKTVYPNMSNVSPDMLKGLSIPTDILTKQARKTKDDKKQKGKEENKPFKRQSYHVAIAYHIHLKQVKINKAVELMDPTFAAKRLREQTQEEMKNS